MIQWYNAMFRVLSKRWKLCEVTPYAQHVPTTMYILCYKPSQLPHILFSQAHCNQSISDSFLYPNAPNNYLKQLCLIWIIPFVLDNLITMYWKSLRKGSTAAWALSSLKIRILSQESADKMSSWLNEPISGCDTSIYSPSKLEPMIWNLLGQRKIVIS